MRLNFNVDTSSRLAPAADRLRFPIAGVLKTTLKAAPWFARPFEPVKYPDLAFLKTQSFYASKHHTKFAPFGEKPFLEPAALLFFRFVIKNISP